MAETDVLIVGAGPTGLVLALWLVRQGLGVRIIDKRSGPGETSRAMAVQARTLELYSQLDIAESAVEEGYKTPAVNLWSRGKHRARIPLVNAGEAITRYPYVLVYPQDRHERLLIERLRSLGVEVMRATELLSFHESADGVTSLLRGADGVETTFHSTYLAGCDGASSTVRHQIGASFEGGTYEQLFYVADVLARGAEPCTEASLAFDQAEFVMVMPYGEANQYRVIGIVRTERPDQPEPITFENVGHKALRGLGIEIEEVNWFSTYRVHHRITDQFRHGRIFLLGDAAHVHSPAGGQGMNTGIQDAINLAWKLVAVVRRHAADSLLDSYHLERQAFAQTLVETTDRLFTFATTEGRFADFVRTWIAPLFASAAYKKATVREYMFRLVSQTTLSYRGSTLSEGKAGEVHGGNRLPWVPALGMDNYQPLSSIGWQVHIYGTALPELQAWCDAREVALHVFPWMPEHERAGLARNAAYLLRPDTYVALADMQGSPQVIDQYFHDHGFSLPVREHLLSASATTAEHHDTN